jgi:hypothetical protein
MRTWEPKNNAPADAGDAEESSLWSAMAVESNTPPPSTPAHRGAAPVRLALLLLCGTVAATYVGRTTATARAAAAAGPSAGLGDRVSRQTALALASGALQPLPITRREERRDPTLGVTFLVFFAPAGPDAPSSAPATSAASASAATSSAAASAAAAIAPVFDPLSVENRDAALEVQSFVGYRLLLNKFSGLRGHVLLVTAAFAPQDGPLTPADLAAWHAVVREVINISPLLLLLALMYIMCGARIASKHNSTASFAGVYVCASYVTAL